VHLYAQFPAEVIDGAPPWSMWLGALAPAEGIWRATRAGTWLSPVEGDAIAEYAEDAVWHMLHRITGERGVYPPVLEQVRFGQAEPYCVRWESGEEPEPEFGAFASPVVARLAPRLAAWVWQKRTSERRKTAWTASLCGGASQSITAPTSLSCWTSASRDLRTRLARTTRRSVSCSAA
jgi:hypothetical protein